MPFPVAHTITGLMAATTFDQFPVKRPYLEVILIALLANLPDFDFAAVFYTHDWYWHRNFSHSLLVAIIIGGISAGWYFGRLSRERWLGYSAVVVSHPLLDMLTTPATSHMGVEFFWPISQTRFAAGIITYPFHDWSHYHGLELVLKFAYISVMEFILFMPLLLLVMAIKRRSQARLLARQFSTVNADEQQRLRPAE